MKLEWPLAGLMLWVCAINML